MEKLFEFGEISERLNTILEDSKKLVSILKVGDVEAFEEDINNIQNQKLLNIAFIGQYSAGKSTIISALTGNRSIKIDADIATDSTTDYSWNNVLLTDTPGLFTNKIDHDDITYKKIKESDLLIYCLTSDLFDDIILNNFKKIAFDELQKNKMMVVINKMSMESGDYDELVKNYKITLNNSLSPNSFDDFPSCFIDAADYLEGMKDNEEDLITLSHFDELVVLLNKFIEEKGIWGKLSTPIYKTISFIDNAILSFNPDKDNNIFSMLKRVENLTINYRDIAQSMANSTIKDLCSTIVSYSNKVVSKIGVEQLDEYTLEKEIEADIERATLEAKIKLQELLKNKIEELNNEVDEQFKTELGVSVINSINNKTLNIPQVTINDFSEVLAHFKVFSNFIIDLSSKIEELIINIKDEEEKNKIGDKKIFLDMIKNTDNFFGSNFKPLKTINFSNNVVYGNISDIVNILIGYVNYYNEAENAKKIEEAKKECYFNFVNIAKDIESQFNKQLKEYIASTFDLTLNKAKKMRDHKINETEINNSSIKKLKEYKEELESILKLSSK